VPLTDVVPRMLLVHGIEDDTVPFTSTVDAAAIVRSCGVRGCEECYVPDIGHQDVVMQLMLGGVVRDLVMGWLERTEEADAGGAGLVGLRSRL